ncbi:MAG: ACT domain-containing protein, partial [Pseudomonadota bacterium]
HILTVLQETRNLGINNRKEDYISAVFHRLPKLEILYLGALFHDIAKGRKGDHSSEGSQDAIDFCISHGLSQYDASLVSWLVQNHLIMSMTAQHKDINDPNIVQEFADTVDNVTQLDYLYMLTVADIRGTNPALWNDWRATLLADLHKYTTFQLRANTPRKNNEIIDHLKASALNILEKQGYSRKDCINAWQEFSEDYFLRHTDNEIAWHTQLTIDSLDKTTNQVYIRQLIRRGCTEIFIYGQDRNYLFANITAKLQRLNLSVLDARIITSKNGRTYNTFHVTDQNGDSVTSKTELSKIKKEMLSTINKGKLTDLQNTQFLSSRLRHFSFKPIITIKNARHLEQTSMQIQATDRPGLLAEIAHALAMHEIKVISARVSTLGEKVHDIFYITTFEDKKILDEEEKQKLIKLLESELAEPDTPARSISI